MKSKNIKNVEEEEIPVPGVMDLDYFTGWCVVLGTIGWMYVIYQYWIVK